MTTHAMTLADYIAQFNPNEAQEIADDIYSISDQYGIDPLFMASIFYVESRYHNDAVSSAGAMGIAQLMPGTADALGVNPYDPYQNIEGGTRYIREMLDRENPNNPYKYNLALASYNAGPGNVNGYAPSYTWDYIEMIRDEYNHLKNVIDEAGGHWEAPEIPDEGNYTPEPPKRPTKRQKLLKAIRQLQAERLAQKERTRY